ncbi:MAG: signal peptide peptidase SppA [Firmicutes bacterium]|nr:signal peptide peptidase SppA [Bacillota bacterium]
MASNENNYVYGVWQPPPRRKLWWLWIVLGVLLLGFGLVLALLPSGDAGANSADRASSPYVGVLYVEGTMSISSPADGMFAGSDGYNHSYLMDSIDEMMEDEHNEGLLLYIDTPGGEVLAADELSHKVAQYKAYTGRPVYAYGHSYAASGGYWLACVADEIFLQRYCLTGSIGVTMGSLVDFSGLLEKHGITVYDLGSGEQKNAGNGLSPTPPETIEIYQGIIDEYYGYFLDWILENRSGFTKAELKTLADGRVYTAKQAVENGLADEVGEYEDALSALMLHCSKDCQVRDFQPLPMESSFFDLFLMQAQKDELSTLLELLPPSGILAYYQYK